MTQPIDTNALRSKAENQRENLRYQGHGEPLTGLAIQAADELDRLRVELSEERHAHNKTQFDLAEARKERALIVAWQPIETCPLWEVAFVTDGSEYAISQKAEADLGAHYWAVDPDGSLWFEPTHWMPRPTPPASGEHLGGQHEA